MSKAIHITIYEMITNTILELLATGVAPWLKSWKALSTGLSPFNVNSGRKYNGINALLLGMGGFEVPAFAPSSAKTPNVKGSQSFILLRPFGTSFEDKVTGERKSFIKSWGYVRVYHYLQLQNLNHDEITAKYTPKTNGIAPSFNDIEICEAVITNMINPPKILNDGGDRAYYQPTTDTIHMPKKESFLCPASYYATLFHEIGHSTGHFTRLDRKDGMENIKFGSEKYSYEELIAELTSCFVCSELGIMERANLENSASYIQSWIKTLQSNPKWVIDASFDAQRASKHILNKNAAVNEEHEGDSVAA